jgi:hypothetical protein
MTQMNEATLNGELDKLVHDATGNNSTFISENEELLDRYEGNPYGDEQPERSKVVSNDVMDIVEADMPALARIFLGTNDVFKFKPNTAKEDDVKEAEDKTKYVNWQVRHQPWSFSVIHGFIKNALIHKTSVVKYFVEEITEVEEHKKKDISNEEAAMFEESFKGEDVEIVREEEGENDEKTLVFKVSRKTKCTKIVDVPLESFRMTKNASDKETAPMVGDVTLMTRGELLALGFDKKTISSLSLVGGNGQIGTETNNSSENSRLSDIRDAQEGGTDDTQAIDDWASEQVEVEDLYPLIDFDGDGIAERRHVMRSGDTVLVNEVFNHVPYAQMSSILMPHKAIGKSRAELAAPTARIKTAILRGVNDNIYAVNNPRMGANKNVEMDDLLVMRPNGVVRTNTETPIANDLMPITIPYIGDKAMQVIQYYDQSRAQTTGSLMASQGLNADDLGKETATRFEGIQDNSDQKVELVARVMAETGFRQLFEGVAWLDANFQNTAVEIEVLGEELSVNPADWKFKHNVVSRVGLGAGDDEQMLQTMSALWAVHQQLQTVNSPMTDEIKRFNILKQMVNASGLPEETEFFNNPERPEQLITAQNEILTNLVQQLQEQVAQLQNPLAEAETIKAQAKLVEAQGKQQIDVAKLAEDQRQFQVSTVQKQDQFMKDLALSLTELEAKFAQQLDAGFQQNKSVLEFDPNTGDLVAS